MSQSARRKKLSMPSVVLPASTPRNPLVAIAINRKAGKHEVSKSTLRRKAARAARIEAEAAVSEKTKY
jgi:hypothetical protein